MSAPINISILLRKSWRTSEGIARVKETVSSLGITPSASGRVSVSGKVPVDSFVKLFGVSPTAVEATPPGNSDFGSPGGYMTEMKLPVPAKLKEFVESISVVPPAVRLH